MKKFLPKTKYNSSGFTLIELLVVIAIIAVLAVMGFAAFGGLTGKANDDRRSADMKAFADAMEVARAKVNGTVYTAPAATDFAGGTFPIEPSTSRTPKYCYLDSAGAAAAPIANPTTASWGGATPTTCPTGWTTTNGVVPPLTLNATYFKFCTINEAGSTNTTAANAAVICQGSKQ